MATYVPPKRGAAYIIYVGLEDQANAGLFKANPTLAAGDFKVSKDGGALANLTDLPTVAPASGKMVKITLTSTEMTADNVTVVCSDAAGAEWYDLIINVATVANQIDDIKTQTAAIEADTQDLQARTPAALIAGRMNSDVGAISTDATAADNLETMLDGTGGATLTLKKLVINNPDALGVAIQVNAHDGVHVEGTNKGVTLQGGSNQALYMLSDTAETTVYIEGPTTGGKGISISSPSDGTSLPGASGIYIQTEGGHPAILFDFTDPADAIKIVNSDNGNWVLDDKLFATASDAADAVRTELAVELAHLDADVSSGGGLTAQETRDAMKLAPTVGDPAAGSVDAHLDSIIAVTALLDTSAVTVTTSNNAGELTLYRGVTFAATVSGLTISASWTKIVFTLKTDFDLADTASTVQIVESNPGIGTDGLLYLNGAALASPIAAADGALTVTQAAGTVAIALSDDATALLSRARGLHWDLKQWVSSATTLLTSGSADIELTPTRTV